MRLRLLACACLLAAVGLAPLAMESQSPGQPARSTFTLDDLRRAEAARDKAVARLEETRKRGDVSAREAADVDADLIAAAADSRRREEAATGTEARLRQLEAEIAAAKLKLSADEEGREDLLAALMALSGRRPPALTTSPDDDASAVRAAILMSEAAPALSARAKELRQTIETLNAATLAAARERDRLTAEESALAARRDEIEALASEKRIVRASLAVETAALEAEARKLAGEADTLRDLLDGLARAAPASPQRKPQPSRTVPTPSATAKPPATRPPAASAPTASRPVAAAPGATPLTPAIGRKRVGFGQTVSGERHPGLTLVTRSGAQIIAPADARVEYAGEFRSYGLMLILDVGGDMLVIVSGLGALYPETGQWVLAGEPIGRMSDQKSPEPELYLEVRRQGQPVDPERWLGRGA